MAVDEVDLGAMEGALRALLSDVLLLPAVALGAPPGRAGLGGAAGLRLARGGMSTASRLASGMHKAVAFSLFGASVVGSGALLVTFGQSMVRSTCPHFDVSLFAPQRLPALV